MLINIEKKNIKGEIEDFKYLYQYKEKLLYDEHGYNKYGFDIEGYNMWGYNKDGYDSKGFNEYGFDKEGSDKDGFNILLYCIDHKVGIDLDCYDVEGYNKIGEDKYGYTKEWKEILSLDKEPDGDDLDDYARLYS